MEEISGEGEWVGGGSSPITFLLWGSKIVIFLGALHQVPSGNVWIICSGFLPINLILICILGHGEIEHAFAYSYVEKI